jgi:hypothetical protein
VAGRYLWIRILRLSPVLLPRFLFGIGKVELEGTSGHREDLLGQSRSVIRVDRGGADLQHDLVAVNLIQPD